MKSRFRPAALVRVSGLHHARLIARTLFAHATVRVRQIGAWSYGCYAWAVFTLLVLLCGGLAVLLHNPPQGRRIARFIARALFRLARMPVSVEGFDRLPAKPHILLANHTSFLDAIVLTALLPSCPGYAFTTRQQFRSQGLLYPLLWAMGTVVLKRSNSRHGTSNVDLIAAVLRRGESLVVFPEGGFTREAGLKPFHTGAFVAAASANVPIAVAGLRGARAALPLGTWLPRRTAITLEIGPTFMPSQNDAASILKLSRAARKAMIQLSGEFDSST